MADEGRLLDLRLLLFGDKSDNSSDDLLNLLVEQAKSQMLLHIKRVMRANEVDVTKAEVDIPTELNWILTEVVVRRFNRLGSEGMQKEQVEGHSITFQNDDFSDYIEIIEDFFASDSGKTSGRVVIY